MTGKFGKRGQVEDLQMGLVRLQSARTGENDRLAGVEEPGDSAQLRCRKHVAGLATALQQTVSGAARIRCIRFRSCRHRSLR